MPQVCVRIHEVCARIHTGGKPEIFVWGVQGKTIILIYNSRKTQTTTNIHTCLYALGFFFLFFFFKLKSKVSHNSNIILQDYYIKIFLSM